MPGVLVQTPPPRNVERAQKPVGRGGLLVGQVFLYGFWGFGQFYL